MKTLRRALAILTCAALLLALPACGSALRPLESDLVQADPALLDAARSVMVMVTVPESELDRASHTISAKISTIVVLDDRHALTAAHSVVGRSIDTVAPNHPAPDVLIGWRTMPARVLERGDPQTIAGEWAVLKLENLRAGRAPTDDAIPFAGFADPVLGERCVLIGYPRRYLAPGWQRGAPSLWDPTPEDARWRPPDPVVFEGRITGVGTESGHRIAISKRGDDLGGLSGGGAFVLRQGVWKLIGPIAHDQQWPWKREIGVTVLPPRVRALATPPNIATSPPANRE